MCMVHDRCTVTSPALVGRSTAAGRCRAVARGRPHQRPVRSGDHAQLARRLVGPGDRDADGHPAAFVAVATEPQSLCHGMSVMPSDHTEGLEQASTRLSARRSELVIVVGDVRRGAGSTHRESAVGRRATLVERPACVPVGRCHRAGGPPPAPSPFVYDGRGPVHVGRRPRPSGPREQALHVEVAGSLQEGGHLLDGGSSETERPDRGRADVRRRR